ncbi:protein of unknown function [Paraburkholderia kururiensis]
MACRLLARSASGRPAPIANRMKIHIGVAVRMAEYRLALRPALPPIAFSWRAGTWDLPNPLLGNSGWN